MNVVIIVLIWLSGSVLGYRMTRKSYRKDFEWTTHDRTLTLIMASLCSWVWVLTEMISQFIENDNGKPASW